MGTKPPLFAKKPLAVAIGALAIPTASVFIASPALAQTETASHDTLELIVVTATRRTESIQDVPLNITAVGGAMIEQQGFRDLTELGSWVPGLHIVDQGPRAANRIVIRGLNADPAISSTGLFNTSGGTVATYVGEIPMYVNLLLNDMDRVEVLMGPQGTLYGAGTLGGAIRYIPTKPQFDSFQAIVRGDAYTYSESDDAGGQIGLTLNWPISDTLALRGSIDYLDDPGFIDYPFLVQEVGVSNPDPDLTDPADVGANLQKKEDVNDEQTTSGRIALRWEPNDVLDATLTYYFQNQDVGGRQISQNYFPGVGDYETAQRVTEPNDRDNSLISLELTADLGFAELTSATGYSEFRESGQRDQTDLLIGLEYFYEEFPSFTAFTQDVWDEDTWTQEIRLVSTGDSRLGWIAGAFYNNRDTDNSSAEYTINYDQFALDEGFGFQPRPDSLEFYTVQELELTEMAVFGELSYDITDDWQVVVGTRWYDYELDSNDATDLPLLYTTIVGDPFCPTLAPCRGQDEIILDFEQTGQDDDGFLFKFNTSYHFNEDMMGFLTISDGYRIGGANGVGPCPDPLPPTQTLCALPNELFFDSDETTNYEVGLRTEWLDKQLRVNGSLYFIDWSDPQLATATENGLLPIRTNGDGAETYGGEVSFDWMINDSWSVRGNYAYTSAELTDDAPDLVPSINPPGFQSTITYEDGEDGDRLPGTPEHQGSLFVVYERPLPNGMALELNYGVTAISDVLTRTGNKGGGEELDGYAIHDLAAHLHANQWTVTLYGKNITDKYAETSARSTSRNIQQVPDINGDPVNARGYYHNIAAPLQVGLRVRYEFEN